MPTPADRIPRCAASSTCGPEALTRRVLLRAAAALALGAAARRPAHAGGRVLWVLADGGATLAALNPDTLSPRAVITLPPAPWQHLFALADGSALLVAADGSVARLSAGGVLRQRAGEGPLEAAVPGDGGRLLLLAGRAEGAGTLLQLLDTATLRPLGRWPLVDARGRPGSGGVALVAAPARQSFVVAPAGLPELWEISHDPRAEDRYEGLVHDFRMGEGVPVPGYLHPRRTRLAQPLSQLSMDGEGLLAVGTTADGEVHGYNLDARRRVAAWPVGGAPRPADGAWVPRGLATWLALPDARRPLLHRLPLDGPLPAPLPLPAPARWVRRAGPWLWVAAGDALWAIGLAEAEAGAGDADRSAAAVGRPVAVIGPPLDLVAAPDGGAAWLLAGGPQPAVQRLDTTQALALGHRPLAAPRALALAPAGA